MKSITQTVLCLLIFTLAFTGCGSPVAKTDIEYHLPHDFEGAVVIFLNQSDGITITREGDKLIVPVPRSGVLKINNPASDFDGLPKFKAIEPNGNESIITYLRLANQLTFDSSRPFESLSEDERNGQVFSMNYEKGSLTTLRGILEFRSFLICKPKDGNLFASRDLNRKIKDFVRAL